MSKDPTFDGRSRRGPYGTNDGDIWLGSGSVVAQMLDDGEALVHEVIFRDGDTEEVIYITTNRDIINRAAEGTKLWIAAQAEQN